MAFCLTISSQPINQSNNRYRSYDVLEKKQVKVKGFDLNSKNGVWSLEDVLTKCQTLCVLGRNAFVRGS